MSYALLQKTLEVPSIEKLKAAFHGSGVLTAADAQILANDAYGILVKGLTAEKAGQLQRNLTGQGVETELVDEQLLPQMPQTKFVRKIVLTPQALMLHDAVGRPFPLEWQHIMMVAAGNVKLQDFRRIRTEREVTHYDGEGGPYTTTEVDYSTKEESNFHFLLEIIVTRAVLRYSVEVNKPFLFQYLGARFDPDLKHSFAIFMQDLFQFIPQVAMNRGAYYLRENAAETFAYPSKSAFYEEIVWLLWRMKQAK